MPMGGQRGDSGILQPRRLFARPWLALHRHEGFHVDAIECCFNTLASQHIWEHPPAMDARKEGQRA
jgi:hypothetical protein